MNEITSTHNPHVKFLVKLATDSRARVAEQQFIADGVRTCSTLIKNGSTLLELYCTYFQLEKAQELCADTKITVVTDDVLKKISPSVTPNGIVARFAIPEQSKELTSGIVLVNISDPGNMGTLIRSCAAFGKKTVVIVEGSDPWSPKCVQATVGTIGLVNILQCSWDDLLAQKNELTLHALVVSGGKKLSKLSKDSLLVIGSEAHGIAPELLTDCDELLTLEMPGGTESLNAGVAGSIALYVGSIL